MPAGVPAESLRQRPIADGARRRIDASGSAAIELLPSERRDDALLPGRLYFNTERNLPWYEATASAHGLRGGYFIWPREETAWRIDGATFARAFEDAGFERTLDGIMHLRRRVHRGVGKSRAR